MARSMVLQLTNINQNQPEGVSLRENNTWTSPGGGWLPVQSGVWNQLPSGLYLYNAANTTQIAELSALNFLTSKKGDKKDSTYPTLGDVGGWRVEEVTP